MTDIEMGGIHDHGQASTGAEVEQTPQKNHVHFDTPATPPTTNRATRSKKSVTFEWTHARSWFGGDGLLL